MYVKVKGGKRFVFQLLYIIGKLAFQTKSKSVPFMARQTCMPTERHYGIKTICNSRHIFLFSLHGYCMMVFLIQILMCFGIMALAGLSSYCITALLYQANTLRELVEPLHAKSDPLLLALNPLESQIDKLMFREFRSKRVGTAQTQHQPLASN